MSETSLTNSSIDKLLNLLSNQDDRLKNLENQLDTNKTNLFTSCINCIQNLTKSIEKLTIETSLLKLNIGLQFDGQDELIKFVKNSNSRLAKAKESNDDKEFSNLRKQFEDNLSSPRKRSRLDSNVDINQEQETLRQEPVRPETVRQNAMLEIPNGDTGQSNKPPESKPNDENQILTNFQNKLPMQTESKTNLIKNLELNETKIDPTNNPLPKSEPRDINNPFDLDSLTNNPFLQSQSVSQLLYSSGLMCDQNQNSSHLEIEEEEDEELYTQGQDGLPSFQTTSLQVATKHNELIKVDYADLKELTRIVKETGKVNSRYECPVKNCKYSTMYLNCSKHHLLNHLGYKLFGCNICGKRFLNYPSLRVHFRNKHFKEMLATDARFYQSKQRDDYILLSEFKGDRDSWFA